MGSRPKSVAASRKNGIVGRMAAFYSLCKFIMAPCRTRKQYQRLLAPIPLIICIFSNIPPPPPHNFDE